MPVLTSPRPSGTYRRPNDTPHWPPPPRSSETEDELRRRLEEERHAKLISDKIDKDLEFERAERKKKKQPSVKILLVGQAESGKSTTLKNFQLHFTPKAFMSDAEAWRTVIHLNLVRSINFILDVVSNHAVLRSSPSPTNNRGAADAIMQNLRSNRLSSPTGPPQQNLSPELRRLRLSLLPLRNAESVLSRRLSVEPPPTPLAYSPSSSPSSQLSPAMSSLSISPPPSSPTRRKPSTSHAYTGSRSAVVYNRPSSSHSDLSHSPTPPPPVSGSLPLAVRVRSQSGWKYLARLPSSSNTSPASSPPQHDQGYPYDAADAYVSGRNPSDFENACAVVAACAEEMNALWRNEDVQALLAKNEIRLRDGPGFYLNDILRIATKEYVPSTEDVLRARLITNGVEEHRLTMEIGHEAGQEWIIYDCGGSRSQRARWAPFFDTVNTIIFLAPISAFDQTLEEDPSVGRLDDTLQLWRAICSNRLLENLQIVLFLNKTDVLKRKLDAGLRFSDFIPSFQDDDGRKNTYEGIVKFVTHTFTHVHNKHSPKPRTLHVHLTSVVDPTGTYKVLSLVRESVIINALTQGNLL